MTDKEEDKDKNAYKNKVDDKYQQYLELVTVPDSQFTDRWPGNNPTRIVKHQRKKEETERTDNHLDVSLNTETAWKVIKRGKEIVTSSWSQAFLF